MLGRSSDWIQHALKRSAWQPQRQVVALATLGFFIALILGALYLTHVASEAATNRRLEELLDDRDDLERVNEVLRAEIARLKSVASLEIRAEALGFQLADQSQILYLPVEGYQPEQPETVAPLEEEPERSDEPAVYDESFGEWLGRQLGGLRESIGG